MKKEHDCICTNTKPKRPVPPKPKLPLRPHLKAEDMREMDASFMGLIKNERYTFTCMQRDGDGKPYDIHEHFEYLGCYLKDNKRKSRVFLKVRYLKENIEDFIWFNDHVLVKDQAHFERLTKATYPNNIIAPLYKKYEG